MLANKVLPGLACFYDTVRIPICMPVVFSDIRTFLMSGCDDILGGGMCWCEQKKHSKNTCSNAPAAVMGLKMFEATGDSTYLSGALNLYNWTRKHLRDISYVYSDNMNLEGRVDPAKYAYNTGQMLQAAALLYKLTADTAYLTEAQKLAAAGIRFFTESYKNPEGKEMALFRKKNTWFVAIMFRGYVELFRQDYNPEYIRVFEDNLNQAWEYARYDNGLINSDWAAEKMEKHKWLLSQEAMVEMFASLAALQPEVRIREVWLRN